MPTVLALCFGPKERDAVVRGVMVHDQGEGTASISEFSRSNCGFRQVLCQTDVQIDIIIFIA